MTHLKVGDAAPEIAAKTTTGSDFVLSAQTSLCTVVYFFPKAFTPGCTRETKRFQQDYTELTLAGASVVGISTDDPETQCKFASSLEASFPLIGDADRAISKAYGVLWPIIGLAHRVTFVVTRARTIGAIFRHELAIAKHGDEVLRFVDELATRTRARAPVRAT